MATSDQYERYYAEKLWAMVPEVYRYEDMTGPSGRVLREIIEVVAEDAARARRSIDRLWEDQHVETADDWAIPYLGDLVGTRMLPEVDSRGRRVDVARTIYFRRRKGTPGILETIAREVSGWDVILVEAFRRLARTAHRLDRFPVEEGRVTRTPRAGTAQLKSPRTRDLTGGAFDELFRTPDPRALRGVRGRFNLAKVNFHLYQQQPFLVGRVTPARLMDAGPVTYTLDPSGRDVPLFQKGQVVRSGSTCGAPWSSGALDDVEQESAECDPRCRATEEWHVSQAMGRRHYDHVAFSIQALHVALLDDDSTTPDDLQALSQLVGYRIEGEPRLRFLLEQQGVDLDPVPSFYRRLLELAVTADSGRKLLAESVVFAREALPEPEPLSFYETVGADLSSRLRHPLPSDPGVLVLLHPELGRFAEPQPQLELGPSEGPSCRVEPEPDPNPGGGDGTDSDGDSTDADGDGGDGPDGDGGEDDGDVGDGSDGDGGPGDGDSGEGDGDGGGGDPSLTQILFFSASGPALLADRTFTYDASGSGYSSVVAGGTSGAEAVNLGVDSYTGNVWAKGDVVFRNRARVIGYVKTEGAISSFDPAPNISDLVNTEEGLSLDFSELAARLDFTISFPGGPDHAVGPWPLQDLTLAPGDYGTVTVQAGGALRLSSGIYKFDRLELDSSASLFVNGSGGKVHLYVKTTLVHRATVVLSSMSPEDLVFVAMGGDQALDGPHPHYGVVVVPHGSLTIYQARSLYGSFYAQAISTNPDENFFLAPWDGTLPGVDYSEGFSGPHLFSVSVEDDEYDVSFALPVGVELDDVVLLADGGPLLTGGNVIAGPTGPGTIVCTHVSPLTVGAGSSVGDVWAAGAVEILAGAVVDGDVHGSTTVNNLGSVTGATSADGFSTTVALSFSVGFTTGAPPQTIAGPEPVELAPGDYGDVEVSSGGRLILRGGDYRLDSLELAPGTELHLDLATPVRLAVRNTLDWGGSVRVIWGEARDFELRFFGSSLVLSQPFRGRLIAPLAAIVLAQLSRGHHEGAFFASRIEVTGSTRILPVGASVGLVPLSYFIGQAGPVGALGVPIELVETPQTEEGGGVVFLDPDSRGVTFKDSMTYVMDVVRGGESDDHVLLLQGLEETRPYVLLRGEAAEVAHFSRSPGDSARLEFAGVWLGSFYDGRRELVIGSASGTLPEGSYDWDEVVVRHSTIDPGGRRADGSALAPIRIVVRANVRRLVIERSVVGPILVDTEVEGSNVEEICIVDSVVDASLEEPDEDGRQIAVRTTHGELRMNGVTVLGDVVAERLSASDCIVTGGLVVADTQRSCFRFGATSSAALPSEAGEVRAPKIYDSFTPPWLWPHYFVSRRFGDPGYVQLAVSAPAEMQTGAENGSEMGAYSFTLRPIRLASVHAKVAEFQPVGIIPQFIPERDTPEDAPSAAE